jgi:hypothetical protein
MGKRATQAGQAIVLIALMLTALIATVSLGIDGGRVYVERRELQDAVDGAALAAADKYLNGGDWIASETLAAHIYGHNERLYASPAGPVDSATCNYSAPALGSSVTVNCTFPSDSTHSLTMVLGYMRGSQTFQISASHTIPVTLMQVVGYGQNVTIGATATAQATNGAPVPAMLTLSQSCTNSLYLNGNGGLTVTGDLVSNGGLRTGNGSIAVAGDAHSNCNQNPSPVQLNCVQSAQPPPCTPPDRVGVWNPNSGVTPDPAYAPPSLAGLLPRTISNYRLQPGIYSSPPGNNMCYFLEGGIYDWTSGYTSQGGFVSNELKPPDEPVYNNNQARSSYQFWNTQVSCAGSFTVGAVADGAPVTPIGGWAVEVTSVRQDVYGAVTYTRESAPSMCRKIPSVGVGQAITMLIQNLPGASSYNVYAQPPPGDCNGPFGYVTNLPNPLYGNAASLGTVTSVLNAAVIPPGFAPSAGAAPRTAGAYPPDGERAPSTSNTPNSNPAPSTWPGGDRANEGQCADSLGNYLACSSAGATVTPGAVAWYFPSGSCIGMTGQQDLYIFSGIQYFWLGMYAPGALYPPANTCTMTLAGQANTTVVGITYMPSVSLSVTGNAVFLAPVAGGIIVNTGTITGNGSVVVTRGQGVLAPVPAARLTN